MFIQAATLGQSNTTVRTWPLVRLDWQAEVCFSSHRRADWGRLALAWPVITLITRGNDSNTRSLMTEVIVVEVPRYAVVAWWMTTAMQRLMRRLLLHACYLNPFVMVATFLWGCLVEGKAWFQYRRWRKTWVTVDIRISIVCCVNKSLHRRKKKTEITFHSLQAIWANHDLIHNLLSWHQLAFFSACDYVHTHTIFYGCVCVLAL